MQIADGDRSIISKYSLKTRPYIGTTSMDAELAFLSANQAKVSVLVCICARLLTRTFVFRCVQATLSSIRLSAPARCSSRAAITAAIASVATLTRACSEIAINVSVYLVVVCLCAFHSHIGVSESRHCNQLSSLQHAGALARFNQQRFGT